MAASNASLSERDELEAFIDQYNNITDGGQATHKQIIEPADVDVFSEANTNEPLLDMNEAKVSDTAPSTPFSQPDQQKKRKANTPVTLVNDNNGTGIDLVDYMSTLKVDIGEQISLKTSEVTTIIHSLQDEVKRVGSVVNDQNTAINRLIKENNTLRSRSYINEGRITRLEKLVYDMHESSLRDQQHSMKDNLIFLNIPENPREDVRKTLYEFMTQEMKISSQNLSRIHIMIAHRVGPAGRYNRSLVAKVNDEGKGVILSHTKNLKGKDTSVFVQLPRELSERRKQLVPIYKDAKSKNINVKWIGDKLQIGDKIKQIKPDKVNDINIDTTDRAVTLKVSRAPPITQDSSSFQGSKVPIATPDDVIPALHVIYADTRVARATHNVYAYRIRPPGSTRTVEAL